MSKRSAEHSELKHPTTKRAKEVDADSPYSELTNLLGSLEEPQKVTKVLHWFRSKDLRIQDNRALHNASEVAAGAGKPLICIYVNCPAEFNWHGTSPARVDFIMETLALMQQELKELDIPLVFLEAAERDDIVPKVLEFIQEQGPFSHVMANYEYEVDELRRDVKLCKQADTFYFDLHHDQTVVEPGTMLSGGGGPMKVFTPYHKAWLSKVKSDPSLLDCVKPPSRNSSSVKKDVADLFGSKVPSVPKEKHFASKEDQERIRSLWPAGHNAGLKRMEDFVNTKIEDYAATRSNPAKNTTSRMSAYFSAGVVSVREALTVIMKYNNDSADFSQSSAGVSAWVREICFRELYRQTLLTTPHMGMNLPRNLKYDFVQWEDDAEGLSRWQSGSLGVSFVDAGMRQLNSEAYLHNRLRMNVSSYLYCNLLIDYRLGERYFVEKLIDWDLANNSMGWEPSYTVFNPVSQAEKNDPSGDYIRRWIPELKNVEGKAIFAPYDRLSKEDYERLCPDYPKPYVNWAETKARAMERFKRDMHDAEP